ncbi:hypothetical protein [Konateibacter massiliensis]|uniref:hypothetical protein n=1 Tax=Konateibacter massiliensis TaxID=2002841 RepID=UPI000C15428D|nr:hypothetical protein [Konateibacter massiliensis]
METTAYLIGRVKSKSDDSIIGYKIYNTQKEVSVIVAKENIESLLEQGHQIVGLKYREKSSPGHRVVLNGRIKNIDKISYIDGEGKREDTSETLILLEVKAFREKTEIIAINGEDKKYQLNLEQIKRWMEHDVIIGIKQVKEDYIVIDTSYAHRNYL